jgi:hypothetical protein
MFDDRNLKKRPEALEAFKISEKIVGLLYTPALVDVRNAIQLL